MATAEVILGGNPGDLYRLVKIDTDKYWVEEEAFDGVGTRKWNRIQIIDSGTAEFLWLVQQGVESGQ